MQLSEPLACVWANGTCRNCRCFFLVRYSRDYDYARFREIADECGAYLHCDMAHNSGLISAGALSSPFEHCDVVTSTTHKTLRGPRSGIIIAKKELMEDIDFAVFPMLQGGPHNHAIGALATQLKEVASPEFKEYIGQVIKNAQSLSTALQSTGNKIATDGTDTHLMLWDLRPHGITGSKMELLCEHVNITLNKNTIHGDRNALNPGAVRIGTPALTTRGFSEADFQTVAGLLTKTVELAKKIQIRTGKPLKAFRAGIADEPEVAALRDEVVAFSSAFPMPGK
jgi:glycine hydroxymethyltransferase